MNGVIWMLLGIWCMVGIVILELRKLNKSFDSTMRVVYIKSAMDGVDDEKEE